MPLNSDGELKYDIARRMHLFFLVFLVCFMVYYLGGSEKPISMFADVDQCYIATSLVATVHCARDVYDCLFFQSLRYRVFFPFYFVLC